MKNVPCQSWHQESTLYLHWPCTSWLLGPPALSSLPPHQYSTQTLHRQVCLNTALTCCRQSRVLLVGWPGHCPAHGQVSCYGHILSLSTCAYWSLVINLQRSLLCQVTRAQKHGNSQTSRAVPVNLSNYWWHKSCTKLPSDGASSSNTTAYISVKHKCYLSVVWDSWYPWAV